MKKIYLLFIIGSIKLFSQSAPTFSITNISFSPTDSVCQLSTQWADIKQISSIPYNDTVFVYFNSLCIGCDYEINKVFWNDLNINGDGSRGINFVIPSVAQGHFDIRIGTNKIKWGQPGYTTPTDSYCRVPLHCLNGII